MRETSESSGTERVGAFSDAVVAVIITLMVLELKAPESASLGALGPLWPTAVSYAVSYLFIAIVWVNHHHLLRLVRRTTPRLIWVNFAHLFAVSLVPFATAWIARTELAAVPVAFYAGVFVCVNLAYRLFECDVFAQADPPPHGARPAPAAGSTAPVPPAPPASATAPCAPLRSRGTTRADRAPVRRRDPAHPASPRCGSAPAPRAVPVPPAQASRAGRHRRRSSPAACPPAWRRN